MSVSRRIFISWPSTSTSLPAVTTVDHDVADLNAQLTTVAAIEQLARPNSDDSATLWLFASRIRQHDTARSGFLGFAGSYNNSIIQWTKADFGHNEIS
jgi:hypothetical protein